MSDTLPPVFWWMSLVGATMLLIYVLWRQEPIGASRKQPAGCATCG